MANYSREISHMMDRLNIKTLSQDKNGFYRKHLSIKLNLLEILMLKQIKEGETVRIHTLIKHLEIDRNLLNTTLKRLISLKLVTKRMDDLDKRGQIVEVTAYGEAIYEEIKLAQQNELDFMLSDVSINEEKAILKFISKIVQYHTEKYEVK